MARVATVSSKGQVTLPLPLRRKYGIKEGTRIVFLESGRGLRVLREDDLEELFSAFDELRKDSGITRKELAVLVKEAKSRLWKERYASRS